MGEVHKIESHSISAMRWWWARLVDLERQTEKKCEWLGQLCASLLLVQRRDWQRARVVDWKCQKLKPKVLSQRCSGRMRRGWVWKPKSKRRKMKRMKREWMNQGPNMNVVWERKTLSDSWAKQGSNSSAHAPLNLRLSCSKMLLNLNVQHWVCVCVVLPLSSHLP